MSLLSTFEYRCMHVHRLSTSFLRLFRVCFSSATTEHTILPRNLRRSERKLVVTPINELKHRARSQRQMRQEVHEINLKPPENGLLVKSLVPVAHEVYAARKELIDCVSRIVRAIPVHICRLCEEVHVGISPHQMCTCNVDGNHPTKGHCWEKGGIEDILPPVESFHLYDRIGRAVSHKERLQVDRIPAIVELCVQAGVDIPEYPTKRRSIPAYSIAGKMVDFERHFARDYSNGKDIQPFGFWKWNKNMKDEYLYSFSASDDMLALSIRGMKAWEKMRSGAIKLMKKYPVHTCGYCTEVQVGPRGHRVRMCQAYKHQMRDGQHAWQEATVDDLVPPVYVWHVPGPVAGGLLVKELIRYYGKLPAVVELFAQAGAIVGEEYSGISREDVAVPGLEEEKLVV